MRAQAHGVARRRRERRVGRSREKAIVDGAIQDGVE